MAEHIFLDNKLELIALVDKKLTRGFRLLRTIGRDALRYVEDYFTIPCIYYTRTTTTNRVSKLKEGEKMKIYGRLDKDEEYGIIVVIEDFEKIVEGKINA
jgi:hypothetical protein